MIIETKFSLGQTVWQIGRVRSDPLILPCRFCRGSKQLKVDAPNGDYAFVTCPRCGGAGSVRLAEIRHFEVIRETRIGKIAIERVDISVPGFNGPNDYRQDEDRYMTTATGFPSGSLFKDTELFASKHEAEEACVEHNEAIDDGRYPEWKPSRDVVEKLRGFLDHRDVYEHTEEHVRQAEALILAYEYEPEDE